MQFMFFQVSNVFVCSDLFTQDPYLTQWIQSLSTDFDTLPKQTICTPKNQLVKKIRANR